jgi:hypothetical protein
MCYNYTHSVKGPVGLEIPLVPPYAVVICRAAPIECNILPCLSGLIRSSVRCRWVVWNRVWNRGCRRAGRRGSSHKSLFEHFEYWHKLGKIFNIGFLEGCFRSD